VIGDGKEDKNYNRIQTEADADADADRDNVGGDRVGMGIKWCGFYCVIVY